MTTTELTYLSNWDGTKLYATGNDSLWTFDFNPNTNSDVWFNANRGDFVVLTGYAYLSLRKDDGYFLTTTGLYVCINLQSEETVKKNWSVERLAPVQKYTAQDTQEVINKLIANNKRIYENNLLCARYASLLTENERSTLKLLQERLELRNEELSNPTFIKSNNAETPSGYATFVPYLEALMNESNAGVGSITLAIIITAVVTATAIGGAGYYLYKRLYEQSAEDVKFSDELTKILTDKLTDEEFAQLKQETQGIVTKAKLKERLNNGKNKLLIYAGAALVALLIIKSL